VLVNSSATFVQPVLILVFYVHSYIHVYYAVLLIVFVMLKGCSDCTSLTTVINKFHSIDQNVGNW